MPPQSTPQLKTLATPKAWAINILLMAALVTIGPVTPSCAAPPAPSLTTPGIALPPTAGIPPKHRREVRQILLSPSGDTLASLSPDLIVLWQLPDLRYIAATPPPPNTATPRQVAIADNGAAIAIDAGTLFLWQRNTEQWTELTTPKESLLQLIGFLGDQHLLWLGDKAQVATFSLLEQARSLHPVSVFPLFLAAGRDGSYLFWTLPITFLLPRPGQEPPFIIRQLEGQYLTTPTGERYAPPLHFDHQTLAPIADPTSEKAIQITPSDVLIFDFPHQQVRQLTGVAPYANILGQRPLAHAISPDARYYALAFENGVIQIWDFQEETLHTHIKLLEHHVRRVHPQKIFDLRFTDACLWLLVPEQRLLCLEPLSGSITHQHEL